MVHSLGRRFQAVILLEILHGAVPHEGFASISSWVVEGKDSLLALHH